MMRKIYGGILVLHPHSFRDRYADEMLSIFEEAAPVCGTVRLLGDCTVSLFRQWVRDPMAWTVIGAVVGGALPLVMAAAMMADWPHVHHHR